MSDDTEKYPPNIQKLFTPKPPLLYKPPLDYPSETRATSYITPLSSWKSKFEAFLQELPEIEKYKPKPIETKQQMQLKKSLMKKAKLNESFERQLGEWNDPELLRKHEQEFMKDPFRTVFIGRLDYSLSELDISKNLSKYGLIESIRIIRDRSGKSRGYGFVVFERETDAKNCISELAPTGLKIPVESKSQTRTILVDIERGRIVRNWKPRRLGGGLGDRHYTKPDPRHSNNASAVASGRRLYVSNNPYPPIPPASSGIGYRGLPAKTTELKRSEKSVRDKYAKYSTTSYEATTNYRSANTSDRNRSIRSIRQRE